MTDFWAGRRVLVTGGSGFIGRAVVRCVAERGAGTVVAPRSAEYDLTRPDDTAKLFVDAQPDLVLHLAARVAGIGGNLARPADLYLDNLLMGTHVLEEARRHATPKTVVVGTICSYPNLTPTPFREESLWDGYPEPSNAPYGIAKKALLVHGQVNRQQYGQVSVHVMPTNAYGPGDKFDPAVSHVIPALVRKCVEARERGDGQVVIWGTGTASRDFLYVDDAAEGIVLAAEHYDSPEPVNLGSGTEVRIRDLAAMIAEYTGFRGELVWDRSKPDGQPRRQLDTTRAEAFGFTATTPFEVGLRRTVEWYLANREEADRPAPAR